MTTTQGKTRRRCRWAAVAGSALAAATTMAACSSSGSGSGTAAGGGAAPIVIGTMAAVSTPQLDYGGIFAALKASAAVINSDGGIHGHPVQVFTCNTEDQANQELACARQAVANHVVAMIGMNDDFDGPAVEQILSQAHIADVENTGPLMSSYQGNNTFSFTWETGSFVPCVSKDLAQQVNAKSVVMVEQPLPPTALFTSLLKQAAAANGVKFLPPIQTPATVSDYSSYVTQAQKSGAGIVLLMLAGSGPQAFVRASSSVGAKYAICTALGLSGSGGWADLGSATSQLYVGATFEPLSQAKSVPLLKTLLDSMAAEKATGDKYADTSPQNFQAQSMGAWLGVQAFAQVAKTISGEVTPSSFLSAIAKAKVNLGGIIPDIDFSKVQSVGNYQRVYNSNAYLWKWNSSNSQYLLQGSIQDTLNEAMG